MEKMEVTYRLVTFRQPDGSLIQRPVRTIAMPESFYDREAVERERETHPDLYIETMHEIDEAFVAGLDC